jgi:CDP-glucose 4,6-dehydratase
MTQSALSGDEAFSNDDVDPKPGGSFGLQFEGLFRGRRVLVTGHNGFAGSWLVLWLRTLGARVTGLSLPPGPLPNHLGVLRLRVPEAECDLRDAQAVRQTVRALDPEIVFHLGAQSILRRAMRDPGETFQTNVMGLVNLLEALRRCPSARALVHMTSDRCYQDHDTGRSFRETDRLGGDDPYSASKACAEIVTQCYQRSVLGIQPRGEKAARGIALATARFGNVIGGGDWNEERLVPDLVRAAVTDRVARLRGPSTTRPWQHVLDPLSGCLMLGARLLTAPDKTARPWNFGPREDDRITLDAFADTFRRLWPAVRTEFEPGVAAEPAMPRLDIRRARERLGWRPVWTSHEAVARSADWFRAFHEQGRVLSVEQLRAYVRDAGRQGLPWTGASGIVPLVGHARRQA